MTARVAPKIIIQTLFGPEEKTYKCNNCCKEFTVEHFYVSSSNEYRPRTQCKDCWKIHNGRSRFYDAAMFDYDVALFEVR